MELDSVSSKSKPHWCCDLPWSSACICWWPYIDYCRFCAAAAKPLQSCPTLFDPIDSSPPGSAVSGILQARTLEGVAISFSVRKYNNSNKCIFSVIASSIDSTNTCRECFIFSWVQCTAKMGINASDSQFTTPPVEFLVYGANMKFPCMFY